ncbi:hypothetical protein Tco_0945558, partial [Tanacetum coccineum]
MATLHGSSPSGNCSGSGHSCQYTNWGMWMLKTRCHTQIRCGNFKGVVLLILLMDDKVSDEAVHKELGDRMERAATTASSLEAEQDSDTILGDVDAQTRFETTSKQSNDPLSQEIQALIDKKKVIITESSIRSDLHLEDVGVFINQQLGNMSQHKKIYVNPSHTKKIFANMKREGKDFSRRITPLFATMMVQPNQEKGVDSGILLILFRHPLLLNHHPLDLKRNSPRGNRGRTLQLLKRRHNKMTVFLHLLMIHLLVVLDLEKAKDAQAKEIADLKKRDKDSLGDHEDASEQGRSIEDIDKDADVSLVDDTQERSDDAEMFDTNDLHGDEVNIDMLVEITLAQTLIQIKATKPKVVTTIATTTTTTRPKARGVVVQEPSKFRTPQESQPSMIKDKGKAIMIEPEVPLKRKDQVALDEDLARNLQAQLEAKLIEEERIARKQEEEANIALIESCYNTQAMIEADFELAQSLQTKEQGEITIKERSRLFVELMIKRKKHFAMLRAEEKRRKPPTKAQKRNLMSIYLKNIGGYKHNQLKSKSYKEIHKLFDNEMRRVNTFIPMDSEVVKSKKGTEESSKGTEDELESDKSKKAKSSEEKAKGSRKKILGKKRAGKEQQQESLKRQRLEDDKEIDKHEEVEVDDVAELKKHLVIVKYDEIAINAIPVATKPPVIVEYKLLKEGIMVHYQLIRVDGSSKRYSSIIRMLQDIDREDLETLWKLVKTKHGDTRPEDEH